MKTGIVTALRNTVAEVISPKKAEKAATNVIKSGEAKLEAGSKAADAQGRAMVKPYVKPQMEEVKVEKRQMKAASGYGDGTNEGDERLGARSHRGGWDEEWDNNW